MTSKPKRIVIAVHGIRTFGAWQQRLRRLIQDHRADIDVEIYRYGYFSVLLFAIPPFRWITVRAFRNRMRAIARENPGVPVSIACHSFGTHIVSHALAGMRPDELPEIPVLILAGSVLRSNFKWDRLLAARKIGCVVNDCGLNDNVLRLSQLLILFTGMAGRVGFYGFDNWQLTNRFFDGGHSHYFEIPKSDPNTFMRQWWLPLLLEGGPPQVPESNVKFSVMQGIDSAIMRVATPVKLVVYGGLAFLVWYLAVALPNERLRLEQGRRQFEAAAAQVSDDILLPDAVKTLSKLLTEQSYASGSERARLADIARFALQRLETDDQAAAKLPDGQIFRWENGYYLKAPGMPRIAHEGPLWQAVVASHRLTLVVGRRGALELLDATDGAQAGRHEPHIDYGLGPEVKAYALRGRPGRLAVVLPHAYHDGTIVGQSIAFLDLDARTATSRRGMVRLGSDCNRAILQSTADPDEVPREGEQLEAGLVGGFFTEGAQLNETTAPKDVMQRYPKKLDDCADAVPLHAIPTLRFPRSVDDASLWRVSARAAGVTPAAQPSDCEKAFREVIQFDFRAVDGPLDASNATLSEGAEQEIELGQIKDGLAGCHAVFAGPAGREYLLIAGQGRDFRVVFHICELHAPTRVGRCDTFLLFWQGNTRFWRFGNGRYLFLNEDTPGAASWSMFDLEQMRRVRVGTLPDDAVVDISFDDVRRIAWVMARRTDLPGALRVHADVIRRTSSRPARRLFDISADGAPPASAASGQLFITSDGVLATLGTQTLTSLELKRMSPWPYWISDLLAYEWWRDLFAEDAILTRWLLPSTGLPPGSSVQLARRSGSDVIVVHAGDSLRVLHGDAGKFLSPVIAISRWPSCKGAITSLRIAEKDDIELSATGCTVSRPGPVAQDEMTRNAGVLQHYLGPLRSVASGTAASAAPKR